IGIIGSNVLKNWTLTNLPFKPEYPGDRQWNRYAAQLRFQPSTDLESLHHPNWTSVIEHVGASLTPYLELNPWAQSNGILTGADYLKCWIASLFQEPLEPLPYLFLYGP